MTDEKRCEPPPEWRDRDGWHWVKAGDNPDECCHWSENGRYWQTSSAMSVRQASSYGYRYLAPVTPPTTVAALAEALEWMIANDDTNEGDAPIPELGGQTWDEFNSYWINGLNKARAALAAYREARR